jgi:S1-C subfamily serine protease
MSHRLTPVVALLTLAAAGPARGDGPARTVEQVAEAARKSVVVVTVRGRDGKSEGLGTGFVVSADGLIATNRHVIGEGRPITVELADGSKHEATAVHASDRALDLAVLRIDTKGLTPLPLGDSASLKDGQPVVALGNPQGLKHSVVSGVVSGRREIDGRPMIQLAIPIEPGNSGGPVLDMDGRVRGLVTVKSLVTANLGFAVGVDALKPLLKKPNPVPMSAWLTFGALDLDEWQTSGGARWRQRAGRVLVEGAGSGFGGRSLCLSRRKVPELPYEAAVAVKLGDESGAAGLAFFADGGDRHYGFYPTGGRLRLTRFEGPDVFSWKVLREGASPHYRPGEWNTLKVRLEDGRVRCYVNDREVFDVKDDGGWSEGRVGLAKFRDTAAEFKQFRLGKTLPPAAGPAEVAARVAKAVAGLPDDPPGEALVGRLAPEGAAGAAALRERARTLEREAARLRELAQAVHQQNVLAELARVLRGPDADADLLQAALLVARLDNDEVDVAAYRREVDRMARQVSAALPKDADDAAKLAALDKYLFQERGFHGSRADYYTRANSYLPEVIDDREGLPITLAVLYIELAGRLGVKVEGVGLPGHFVVRHVPAKGQPQLIDVYEGGKRIDRAEAARRVEAITGEPLRDEHLAAVGKRAVVVRMLHNLLNVARGERDAAGMLRYLDAILAVTPDSGPERGLRAGLRYQAGDRSGALRDVDWLLEHRPDGLDIERLQELRRELTRPGR